MLTGIIYTKKEDMYRTYPVLRLLNPGLSYSDFQSFIDHAVATSNYTQYVILNSNQEPVAVVAFTDKPLLSAAPKKSMMIQNIAVSKDYQGQRLGMFLLQAVIEYAKANGYSSCNTTNLWRNEAAIRMNQEAGFSYRKAGLGRIYFFAENEPPSVEKPPHLAFSRL